MRVTSILQERLLLYLACLCLSDLIVTCVGWTAERSPGRLVRSEQSGLPETASRANDGDYLKDAVAAAALNVPSLVADEVLRDIERLVMKKRQRKQSISREQEQKRQENTGKWREGMPAERRAGLPAGPVEMPTELPIRPAQRPAEGRGLSAEGAGLVASRGSHLTQLATCPVSMTAVAGHAESTCTRVAALVGETRGGCAKLRGDTTVTAMRTGVGSRRNGVRNDSVGVLRSSWSEWDFVRTVEITQLAIRVYTAAGTHGQRRFELWYSGNGESLVRAALVPNFQVVPGLKWSDIVPPIRARVFRVVALDEDGIDSGAELYGCSVNATEVTPNTRARNVTGPRLQATAVPAEPKGSTSETNALERHVVQVPGHKLADVDVPVMEDQDGRSRGQKRNSTLPAPRTKLVTQGAADLDLVVDVRAPNAVPTHAVLVVESMLFAREAINDERSQMCPNSRNIDFVVTAASVQLTRDIVVILEVELAHDFDPRKIGLIVKWSPTGAGQTAESVAALARVQAMLEANGTMIGLTNNGAKLVSPKPVCHILHANRSAPGGDRAAYYAGSGDHGGAGSDEGDDSLAQEAMRSQTVAPPALAMSSIAKLSRGLGGLRIKEELRAYATGLRLQENREWNHSTNGSLNGAANTTADAQKYPASFDWRVAAPACLDYVHDQEGCASSHMFASVDSISDRHCIDSAKRAPTSRLGYVDHLSVMHAISCEIGDNQCAAGWAEQAFRFARGGLTTEKHWEHLKACASSQSGASTAVEACAGALSTAELDAIDTYGDVYANVVARCEGPVVGDPDACRRWAAEFFKDADVGLSTAFVPDASYCERLRAELESATRGDEGTSKSVLAQGLVRASGQRAVPPCGTREEMSKEPHRQCSDMFREHKISGFHYVFNTKERFKQEVYTGGPIYTSFHLYEDFPWFFRHFPSHGYSRSWGFAALGGHAAVLVGWEHGCITHAAPSTSLKPSSAAAYSSLDTAQETGGRGGSLRRAIVDEEDDEADLLQERREEEEEENAEVIDIDTGTLRLASSNRPRSLLQLAESARKVAHFHARSAARSHRALGHREASLDGEPVPDASGGPGITDDAGTAMRRDECWLLRNTWGGSWADDGYFRMAQGQLTGAEGEHLHIASVAGDGPRSERPPLAERWPVGDPVGAG